MRYLSIVLALLLMLPLIIATSTHPPSARSARGMRMSKPTKSSAARMPPRQMLKNTIDHYTKLSRTPWTCPPSRSGSFRQQMYEICKIRNRFKRSEVKGIDGKGYLIISGTPAPEHRRRLRLDAHQHPHQRHPRAAEIYHPEWESEYNQQRRRPRSTRRSGGLQDGEAPAAHPIELVKEGASGRSTRPPACSPGPGASRPGQGCAESPRDFIMLLEAYNTDQDSIPFTVWSR